MMRNAENELLLLFKHNIRIINVQFLGTRTFDVKLTPTERFCVKYSCVGQIIPQGVPLIPHFVCKSYIEIEISGFHKYLSPVYLLSLYNATHLRCGYLCQGDEAHIPRKIQKNVAKARNDCTTRNYSPKSYSSP